MIAWYRRLRRRLAVMQSAEIEAELEVAPPPPINWHVRVRGQRHPLEFTYLGPIVTEKGHVLHNWRAIRPVGVPEDISLDEVQLEFSVLPARTQVQLWLAPA